MKEYEDAYAKWREDAVPPSVLNLRRHAVCSKRCMA